MGYLEDIEALDLADDVKAQLIASHQAEVDPLQTDNQTLKRKTKKASVEAEIATLSDMLGDIPEKPGILKYVRRVYLSDDEEPGTVLLSDAELELSGEEATGASSREELTVAGGIRKFIELMPKNAEGKINLGSQLEGNNDDTLSTRPKNGDPENPETKAAEKASRTARLAGKPINRTRARYGRAASTVE